LTSGFQLLLFSTDADFITSAVAAGVDGIVVDWERFGKAERQASADTQIGSDTLRDLERVRASTEALIVCRLNALGPTTTEEVDAAAQAGADEILLPMVRTTEEVEAVLEYVKQRCGVGIMVETVSAVESAKSLASLPISRAYVGLNDLAIERNSQNIFAAVADGTVERIRRAFSIPVAFASLTMPDKGSPIPSRLLLAEMMRLHCDFGVLRRSFHRDIQGRDPTVEIPRIRASLDDARRRAPEAVERDHRRLLAAIKPWEAAPP
jgi:HpcH/HpaI aldolase/citrate lyase family protein